MPNRKTKISFFLNPISRTPSYLLLLKSLIKQCTLMPSISLCVWATPSKLFKQQTFGILSKVFHKQKNNKNSNTQNRGDKDRFLVG